MSFKIYKIETYGIKNIEEKIVIDFYPQTISQNSKKKIANIKAIYGTNGTGKSSFIESVLLYKRLVSNEFLLKQSDEVALLNNLINKNKKEFYFSVIFTFSNPKKKYYKHEIKMVLDNDIPYIAYERLSELVDRTINGKYDTIYEVNNGELHLTKITNDFDNFVLDRSRYLLKMTSFASFFKDIDVKKEIRSIFEKKEKKLAFTPEKYGSAFYMVLLTVFVDSITIYLDENDKHKVNDFSKFEDLINRINEDDSLKNRLRISSGKDIILKSSYTKYLNDVKKLTKFIRLFKPDLKNIKVETQEDENFMYCSKKMQYENYDVDLEFESTGIKKLVRIFKSIEDVTKDNIVFIDELDANINGVYLNKLLEYLYDNGNGQLCFTTHNLYPMEYLCQFNNSIDFIGETGKVVQWKKNGNYKPYIQYPEGFIIDSPFNIESIDFIDVFEDEGDN